MIETMDQLYLIARVAGQRVAFPSAEIDSVVEIEAITPVPRGPRHIAGLAALRSRVLTVISAEAALGLDAPPPDPATVHHAAVVTCEGHLYGVIVEEVEDVVTISGAVQPLRSGFGSGWARVALGMIEYEGEALLLLGTAALVAGPLASAA